MDKKAVHAQDRFEIEMKSCEISIVKGADGRYLDDDMNMYYAIWKLARTNMYFQVTDEMKRRKG
jgi:hypothetical protein